MHKHADTCRLCGVVCCVAWVPSWNGHTNIPTSMLLLFARAFFPGPANSLGHLHSTGHGQHRMGPGSAGCATRTHTRARALAHRIWRCVLQVSAFGSGCHNMQTHQAAGLTGASLLCTLGLIGVFYFAVLRHGRTCTSDNHAVWTSCVACCSPASTVWFVRFGCDQQWHSLFIGAMQPWVRALAC